MKPLNKKSLHGLVVLFLLVFQMGCAGNSSLSELQRSAADGNAQAQYELGFKYETGIDVARNLDTALALYRLSAQQGNVLAKNNLTHLGGAVQTNNTVQPIPTLQSQDYSTIANNHVATDSQPARIEPNSADDARSSLSAMPTKKSTMPITRSSQSIPSDEFANAEIDEGFKRC